MILDPLSDVLRSVRMKGGVFLDVRLTEPWCIASRVVAEDCSAILQNPSQIISFHYLTKGTMLASIKGGMAAMPVEAGEIIMMPRNDPHILASAPGLPSIDGHLLVQPSTDGGLARVVHGGGGKAADMLCGFLACEEGFNPLVAALPPIIKVNFHKATSRGLIEASMAFAASELARGRVANSGVMSRLSEMLFVEAVRSYAETSGDDVTSWLRGLGDPQIGQALSAMHRDIANAWTAEGLAKEAGMSRSAFVQRFTAVMNVAPIRYLTAWRLAIGKRVLGETAKTIGNIGFEVGYESEDAFSRAFKREYGVSPAKWRAGTTQSRALPYQPKLPIDAPPRPSSIG